MGIFVRQIVFWAVLVGLLIMTTSSAYAYIDPGTGSYLLQVIAAGVLAALFMLRAFWKHIKESLASLTRRRKR